MRLVAPLRVWFVFNGIFIALAAASFAGYYRIAAQDSRRLVTSQESTLSRARIRDLQSRRFREFVEGVGSEFNDLSIRVEFHDDAYEFGQLPASRHCARTIYPLKGTDGPQSATVTMCRPFRLSTMPMFAILIAYLIVSAMALRIVHRIDARAAESLAAFLRGAGAQVDEDEGTVGILNRIQDIITQLKLAQEEQRRLAYYKTRGQLAEQVAHDLRSPLAALESLIGRLASIPTHEQGLARSAIARIQGIAEDLLAGEGNPIPTHPEDLECVSLDACVMEVLSEKTLQYGASLAIGGKPPFGEEALHGTLARAPLVRVLSNLIDNAMQCGNKMAKVSVTARPLDSRFVTISVEDSGPGIPPDILPKLGQRGATFGKKGGNGLGLWHARTTVESWGGRLEIESEVGIGTTVRLILPRAEPPPPTPASTAVLIDDDPLVRMNWTLAAKRAGKTLRAYADAPSFIKEAGETPKDTPVYIDSDLGEGAKGEEAAKELHALGFTELRLATGHDPASFPPLPHIKGIRGKEPPWAAA
jgi:signal transduction histidine kinase